MIFKRFSSIDLHTKEVFVKSALSTIVKISGMLLGLGISIFLGRNLGPEGLGVINLAHRIIGIVMLIGLFGLPQVLVKEIAIAHKQEESLRIAGLMKSAQIISGGIIIVLVIILLLTAPFVTDRIFKEPLFFIPFIIAIVEMVPMTFSRIFAAGLNGFRKIWQSNLVEKSLSLLVVSILLVALWLFKIEITINRVAFCYFIGRIVVLITVRVYWGKLFTFKGKSELTIVPLLKKGRPILIASLAGMIINNISFIMLGWLSTSEQVGLFSVASRLALLTSFFLLVTNTALSPKIAALYAEGKLKKMEKMVQNVTKGLTMVAVIPLIAFIFGGHFILGLWSSKFIGAYSMLIILTIGQLFNISTGATGVILIMCGYEKIQAKISLIFLVLSIILNYVCILYYGAIGAAIASAIGIAFINIAKLIIVKLKVGIITFPYLKI